MGRIGHRQGRIGRAWDESGTGRDESAARASRQSRSQPVSQTKNRNHFMSTATTTSTDTGQNQSPRSTTQPTNNPTNQLGRSAANRLRTTMAAQNVVPVAVTAGDKIEGLRQWASGRCLSADRAGVYSRTEGSGSGRVRRWCEQIEAGRENTEGSRPVMATCSPRVGITLASLCQACLRRRKSE